MRVLTRLSLGPRYCHGIFATCCRLFGLQKGGSRAPQDSPLATPLLYNSCSTLGWINQFPLNKYYQNNFSYPVDSYLSNDDSSVHRFEQFGPRARFSEVPKLPGSFLHFSKWRKDPGNEVGLNTENSFRDFRETGHRTKSFRKQVTFAS